MRVLDPTYIRDNVDYSFGDESGVSIGGYMKLANDTNAEFMEAYQRLRHTKNYMTLFIDNIRLYRRAGIKYTAVEEANIHVRQLKDEKIIRLQNEDLLQLLSSLPDMNFVIFTGFEDTPIDEHIFEKIPNNVLAIYASNCITFGGKVKPMPYGLQRKLSDIDHRQEIILSRLGDKTEPTKLLYLNHSANNNPIRVTLDAHFSQMPWATVKSPSGFGDTEYNNYLLDIKAHKFMLCPSGNAIGCECHRDWETLYMRRVPIVLRSKYLEYMFKDFPVLFVDDFFDVTEELLIANNHLYEEVQSLDMRKLDIKVLYDKLIAEVNMPFQKKVLSIYGSHDSGAVFIDKTGKIKILEYERFVKRRYSLYSHMFDDKENFALLRSNDREREQFLWHIRDNMEDHRDITTIIYEQLDKHDLQVLKTFFPKASFMHADWKHHTCHAASGYLTSPFKEALIISIDGGGGEDGATLTTKTFIGEGDRIFDLEIYPFDIGTPYGLLGIPISEIKAPDNVFLNLLSNPGKIMGLCAYGKVREEWVEPITDFYHYHGELGASMALHQLGYDINLDLDKDSLCGELSYDFAATSQYVFETLFFRYLWPMIKEQNKNVVLVGGCALNVLLNQKIKHRLLDTFGTEKQLFVPMAPNDCGLALGQFLYFTGTRVTESLAYNGMGIVDESSFESWKANKEFSCTPANVKDVVEMLRQGKIIGIIDGNSEVGPRALGNRSIICDPSIADMKDTLNNKVKFREWFRPFAPVCRLQDKDTYFIDAFESEYMSYAPRVRPEYSLPAITHVDGTARLQTVTQTQHALFYDILTELGQQGAVPVILNTSFNIKGKPILSSYEDAFDILRTTELDFVYSKGYLFSKLA